MAKEALSRDLWVFIETREDGSPRNVGLELLNPGRMLAGKQGGALAAVVIGGRGAEQAVREAGAYGADKIYVVQGDEYARYNTDAYVSALQYLVEKYGPTSMLIGATSYGRDLGPRIACRLQSGLTADCTALDIDPEDGKVAWTRPAFGGNLMAVIKCPESFPQIGTVRPGVFKKAERTGNQAEVIREEHHVPGDQCRVRMVEVIREAAARTVDLEEAEIIVSGGRGVGGPEGFPVVKQLADALGGVVGASRAAVDAGWIPYAHQVGQTGKTVAPRIYIACGISGAIQHVAGMSGADCIIAINKDPSAPIFDVSNYGIVGDLFEVVPALAEEIRALRGAVSG